MNVKQVIELEITDSGMNGEGVSRFDGKVVFVPYALKGEMVRAVVREVKKKYAFATVIKVLSPSPHRVEPICPHYYKCGGCDAMHISEQYRREMLISELRSNLKKIADINIDHISYVTSEGTVYRNKLSMPFGRADGKTVLGLYRQGSHRVEPVECLMSPPLSRSVAAAVLAFVRERGYSVYDGQTGEGLLRHLVLREIGGRATATLVINGKCLPGDGESALASILPDEVDLFICPNTERGNVILGTSVRAIKGKERMPVEVLGVKAMLSPLSFFQVNDGVRDKLYGAALAELDSPMVLDLYSGIGITSNLAARKAQRVFAVECVPQATADADETALLNGNADKITNICGDVERVLPDLAPNAVGSDILVDPPRKGCGSEVMRAIAGSSPKKLVYISCNNATMCRDIRVFLDASENEYTLNSCTVFNMFPNTHHCETLCVLERK